MLGLHAWYKKTQLRPTARHQARARALAPTDACRHPHTLAVDRASRTDVQRLSGEAGAGTDWGLLYRGRRLWGVEAATLCVAKR